MFDNKYTDFVLNLLLKTKTEGEKEAEHNVKHWGMEVKFPKLNNGPKLSAMDGF